MFLHWVPRTFESCQPSKVPAKSAMTYYDPMGLLMQLGAPASLEGKAGFWSWCQDHLHFLDWFGNQQFKHFNPGTCLAAYALSWCACDSSRCVPLLPLLDYLSQFSEHAGELGTRLRSLASERFRRHHAWEGRWLVRQMDRCRLSRPLSRPHQAQLGANMNKTKW